MQKEYLIQLYKTINKLLCNLSFAGQYIFEVSQWSQQNMLEFLVDKYEVLAGKIFKKIADIPMDIYSSFS